MLHKMDKAIGEFIGAIEPFAAAYDNPKFTYVAIKQPDGFHIIRSRLYLDEPYAIPLVPAFSSGSIVAGQFWINDTNSGVEDFLKSVGCGKIEGTDHALIFDHPIDANSFVSAFHTEGLETQSRLTVLTATGDPMRDFIVQPQIDWELRAANPPFDSLAELMQAFRVGNPQGLGGLFEAVAGQIAAVDYQSPVQGNKATPTVRMHPKLNPEHVSVGIRVLSDGKVISRNYFSGTELLWENDGAVLKGAIQMAIPDAAILHCFLSYKGNALHYGWINDPVTTQNARRAVLAAFDPSLSVTTDLLMVEPGRGKSGSSSDLETGVAWLLWTLGFSVLHLGASRRTTEAFDVLAVSPSGNYAVVECTTGVLNAHNKLANLVARSDKVRRELDRSGNGNSKVISIIVTSRPRSEVRADLSQASSLGVVVITRDELESALVTRTRLRPDADALYAEAEGSLTMPSQT